MKRAFSKTERLLCRSVVLVIAVSLMMIPVRCDASSMPHSLFVDPMVDDSGQHGICHHTAFSTSAEEHNQSDHSDMTGASEYSGLIDVLNHSHVLASEDVDAIEAGLQELTSSESAAEPGESATTDADPSTMDPMGGLVDVPYSISLPAELGGALVAEQRVLFILADSGSPEGFVQDPIAPPPRLDA